jgi:nucleotide-binding universal stress UspA family protein
MKGPGSKPTARRRASASPPIRIRSVLVPLDGSPFAEQALPWAAAIAVAALARLRLTLVHQSPSPPPLDEGTRRLYTRIELALRKSEREYLAKVADRLRQQHGAHVAKATLQGAPAPALVRYVREVEPEIVVMTTHGAGGIRRAWIGSVADQLVRSLETPLLLIRPREGEPVADQVAGTREILVALDGSRRAEAALPPAATLAMLLQARLALIRVVHPIVRLTDPVRRFPLGFDEELTRLGRAEAQDYLEGVAERLSEAGAPASGVTVLGSSVFEAIQDAARAPGTGMIALASHGRGGVPRLVLGSVADKLVRGGELPVLVTRPRGR